MRKQHNPTGVQRFHPKTSVLEEGCALSQAEGEPKLGNLGEGEKLNQRLVKKCFVPIDQMK